MKRPRDIFNNTPVYRMVHIDSLHTLLKRGAIHAPNCRPEDGHSYVGIHAEGVQVERSSRRVPCGAGGSISDYVGFYFGPRSPMLLRIHTGHNVQQIGQSEVIYLVSIAQDIAAAGLAFAFTDRHSLARLAAFHDNLADLGIVNFDVAYADVWNTTPNFPERQELKQAEFLVYRELPWNLIRAVGVLNGDVARRVETLFDDLEMEHRPPVITRPNWYY